jgi:hypothetical protein
MTTAPPPKVNLLYLGLDGSDVTKRHLGVGMSHQPHQTLACSDLLAECLGLVMRGVGEVHRGHSEQNLRLGCVYAVLCCID